ncbi:MAG: 50S ribosomal protein L13 [Gemmataceae bacterium]
MTTYMAKPNEVERRWWLVDATDQIVGRLAVRLARILMGKHRPQYTPHVDTGDFIVVINAEKVRLTGKKSQTKVYHWYTGYPGGLKQRTFKEMLARNPTKVLREAVRRMMPKNKLGRHQLAKLKIYAGPTHPHQAQQPQPLPM